MSSPGSISDGEIVENGEASSKATPLHQSVGSSGVDRQGRNSRPRSRSPAYRNGSGSGNSRRSRSPRGFKRSRDDRDGSGRDNRGADPRRFKRYYEDERGHIDYDDAPRPSSRDAGRPPHSSSRPQYDGGRSPMRRGGSPPRDQYRNENRRFDRGNGHRDRDNRRGDGGGGGDRYSSRHVNGDYAAASSKYSAHDARRDDPALKRAGSEASDQFKSVAKSGKGASGYYDRKAVSGHDAASRSNQPQQHTKEPDVDIDFDAAKAVDEEAEIERRRRRREEILRKSRASTPMIQTLHVSDRASATPGSNVVTPMHDTQTPRSIGSPALSAQDIMSPNLDLANDQALINTHREAKVDDEDGPSAADYDPTVDMQEDERRDEMRHGEVGLHGQDRHPSQADLVVAEPEEAPKNGGEEGAGDDDDDFNMFAEDFDEEKFAPKPAAKPADAPEAENGAAKAADNAILDGDDKDGYYKIRPGEILGGRYEVQSTLGKGMFSGVARATDITTRKSVAIKIMRNNDALRKGGFTEIAILQKLNAADPEGKKHVVRFERSFEYKGHLCMAFENLSMNLREVLKKFGNNVGINLHATRAYAYQIFLALGLMRKCSIIHADLKPDNILVNEGRNVLKICDLGTAIDRSDAATAHMEITPYLVSRFYRAPEIILGMPYDYAVDMWSIGCTLYEMYTGKILFTGDSNNQMLKTIQEIRGRFSPKLYRRGQLAGLHFDDMGNFVSVERDKALGKTVSRTIAAVKPTRDLRTRLLAASGGMTDAETRELNHFVDLLERCLALNPDKRITPGEALRHPFFTQRIGGGGHAAR